MPSTGSPNTTRYHFYLSYAHSAPLGADAPPDTDHSVGVLFKDLSREVADLLGADRASPAGYYDDTVVPGAGWKATLGAVLGATDVFVALYSPGYFTKSWPRRERAAYMRRFGGVHATGEQAARLLPVLWVPLLAWEHPEERAATLALGAGIPEYAENGLRALSRLAAYESQYRAVVRRLARRIVEIAGTVGPRPAGAVAIDDLPDDDVVLTGMPLTVVMLAPARHELPPGRAGAGYGQSPEAWQPYGAARRLPITGYTANIAERLGLPTRVVDARTGFGTLAEGPVLVLIDPWMAATPRGRETLSRVSQRLPEWATLVTVADRHDPQYAERGDALGAVVTDRLGRAGERRIRQILHVDQLIRVMPSLIDEACRRYLKIAPVFLPKGAQPALPRIAGTDHTDPEPGERRDD